MNLKKSQKQRKFWPQNFSVIRYKVYISIMILMLVSGFLLIVMFVCSLEHHDTKQNIQDQVSPGMLYNEERRKCLMTKADIIIMKNKHKIHEIVNL